MSDGINYEIWTTPTGTFNRVADITRWVLPGTSTDHRLIGLPSGTLKVHEDCPAIASILTVDGADHTNDVGSTLMMFDNGTWIGAYVPTRRVAATDTKPWHEYTLEGMEWYFDRGRVRAFDYNADPIKEGDWIYGAPTILPQAGGEISDAQWFLWIEGASSGTFTITDGTDTTSAINWDVSDPSTIKTRLQTDITAITTVAVDGTGTKANVFLIVLTNPGETNLTLTVNDSTNGTVTLDQTRAGGTLSPRPWHGLLDGNTGLLIGNYDQFDMVEEGVGAVPAAPAGSPSTHLLRVDGFTASFAGDYAGGQVEAAVIPGHRYRASIDIYSPTAQTIRFIIRNLTEGALAFDQQDLTAATWTTMSITTFTPNVEIIAYRFGIIDDTGDPGVVYADVNNATLAPGEAEQNFGEIATDLRAPMDARNVLDWVVETWTAANDSSAVAWDQDLSVAVRKGQSMMQWLEYGSRWGYERSIEYDSTNPAATPFDFNLYNPGNRDDAPTAVSVSAIDGMIAASPVEEAAPDMSSAIAEGDEGRWGESSTAALATGWGVLEGYFANRQGRDSTDLDVLAAQMVTDSADETVSLSVTVQNPSKVFGIDFKIGDTIPVAVHAADGTTTPTDYRLVGCVITETDTLPTYKYSFGAVVFDAPAAQADAIRTLVRRYQALDNIGKTTATDPSAFGVRGALSPESAGAHIHLTRAATQSIASAGADISWDSFYGSIPRLSFSDPALPATSVTVPLAGYYNIDVGIGWSSFTGGGTISIIRTRSGEDTTIWPPADDPGLWTATYGRTFEGVAPAVPMLTGDSIKVNVNPDDASAQTLSTATLGFYLVDRGSRSITYRDAVLASGPLAYWRLDEVSGTNAADSAGHASGPFDMTYNSATLNQTPVMTDGTGSPSIDVDADAGVDGADWSAFDFAGSAAYTLEAWFVTDEIAAGQSIIIHKQVVASGDGWEFIRDGSALGSNRIGATSHGVSGGTLVTGTTYYGVVTYDATTPRLYLDGVLIDSDATVVSQDANTVIVSIGRDADTAAAHWNGRLDEVAVYDRALTAAEIVEHYEIGRGAA
jgi:hypothetical protein